MREFHYTRLISIIIGIVIIVFAIGFGFLALISLGLSKAWSIEESPPTQQYITIIPIFIFMLLVGLVTSFSSLILKYIKWTNFYIGLVGLMGISFIILFFVSWGALGLKMELLILLIGILYLGLGYMAYKRK